MIDFRPPLEQLLVKLSENPENPKALFEVGRAYLDEGDTASALKNLEAAQRANPEDWKTLEYYGCALVAHGEFERAVWAFTELCRLMPGDPYDALFLASARLLSGEKNLGFILRKSQQGQWPYPIAPFLKGELGFVALLAYAEAEPREEDRLAYVTESHFYAGIRALAEGEIDAVARHFQSCTDTTTYEGIMAQGLLRLSE